MRYLLKLGLVLGAVIFFGNLNGQASRSTYLDSIKSELKIQWPKNRTIRIVFHGHSVPAGYFKTPVVNSMESYPNLTHKKLSIIYPNAVISPIVTAIGGEQSESGSARFEKDVLLLNPDLIFIDYSLNDRSLGLKRAKMAWEGMIERALEKKIKVVLLTPTPDLSEDILDDETSLAKHSQQVRALAEEYKVGLVDSYQVFKSLAAEQDLKSYMAQGNHINELGHDIVANEIIKWFNGK
jgi:hypothetical protein